MESKSETKLNLKAIQDKLSQGNGKDYYRSLEEVAHTPEFQKYLGDEFPNRETLLTMDRRQFLKVMGASIALAGLSGCRFLPQEKIVPYVKAPEDIIPGKSLRYATAMTRRGEAFGLVVESKMGRPTKIEGNDLHPASLGATDVFAQAELLALYDPDRGRNVLNEGQIASYDDFLKQARETLAKAKNARIVTDRVASPTLRSQLEALIKAHPGSEWIEWEPFNDDEVLKALSEPGEVYYDLSKADVIVSLDCDLFADGPWGVRYARDFANGRRVTGSEPAMNRLYTFESGVSTTGLSSDHRFAVKSSDVPAIAEWLVYLYPNVRGLKQTPQSKCPVDLETLKEVASDLYSSNGRSVVVVGKHQPESVHWLAYEINSRLEALGKTALYRKTTRQPLGPKLDRLIQEVASGKVDWLLTISANPLLTAPSASKLASTYDKIPFSASVALIPDETSEKSKWYVPQTHFLEAWSDAESRDGTVAIIQPLIKPLHNAASPHEVLASLLDRPKDGYDIVKGFWEAKGIGDNWEKALHDGLVPAAIAPGKDKPGAFPAVIDSRSRAVNIPKPLGFEVNIRPDPTLDDGRYSNNGWLQELPKPITTVTWDNVVQIGLKTAEKLKVQNEDVVSITVGNSKVEGPIWIVPGHAEDSVTVHAGFGRTQGGRVCEGVGFDVYPLRQTTGMAFAEADIQKTGKTSEVAAAQTHHSMEGRDIVRVGTLEEYRKRPSLAPEDAEKPDKEKTMFNDKLYENDSDQWGMSIDLNTCIGCNACTIACQAENNIPVVGKEQVQRGREMHWIRVDHYFSAQAGGFEHVVQPVNCMQCENAPCEPVCPVAATIHSHEGLNQMVYNRCVGTRYCSNNCPYKVRRFNFLNFQYAQKNYKEAEDIPLLKLLNNPDVTVRSRGVMEKCTYCVQRINEARIETKKKGGTTVKDGDIVTACQQACPTQAIIFGNIADPKSKVSQAKAEPRDYGLLEMLNTRPRTSYLAKVRNPNPRIKA